MTFLEHCFLFTLPPLCSPRVPVRTEEKPLFIYLFTIFHQCLSVAMQKCKGSLLEFNHN